MNGMKKHILNSIHIHIYIHIYSKTVLCFLRKIIFFYHHNFMKKGHSKLSKNEPENIPSIKITYL